MAIRFDTGIERFRDSAGRFVTESHARLSSIARADYQEYQLTQKPTWQILDIFDPTLEGLDHYDLDLFIDGDLWDDYEFYGNFDDVDIMEEIYAEEV